MVEKRLGRGLASLLGSTIKKDEVVMLSIDSIKHSRFQPRKKIDNKKLIELAESIKSKGVIEPIIVRTGKDGYYELICGERRLRASKIAGLDKIPAIVKNVSDEEAFELALIENLQREDLTPLEFALAFDKLTKMGYTHEEIAKKVGKSRPWITNIMRIMNLPDYIKELIDEGKISLGHAKILCSIADKNLLKELSEQIVNHKISVRELENIVKKLKSKENDIVTKLEERIKPLLSQAQIEPGDVRLRDRGKFIEIKIFVSKESLLL